MKKITLLAFALPALVANLYGWELSGTAATSASNIIAGNSSFVIVDTTGGDTLTSSAFTVGLTLSAGTSFGDYYVASYNSVVSTFGTTVSGNATFSLGDGGVEANDTYYVVAFGTQSGDGITLTNGDTFGILSGADWQLDANDASSFDYGTDMQQFTTFNGAQFTVVPEPSAFAAIAGVMALGFVMVRRRG